MSDPKSRLEQIRQEAAVLSVAYRLRLVGRLWWANMFLVVLPAAFATGAAFFAGKSFDGGSNHPVFLWLTGSLAGAAAVLVAVHKALKCEEYQAECMRLGQSYKGIAIKAASENWKEAVTSESVDKLTQEMASLTEGAKAPLPNTYLAKAAKRTGYYFYDAPPRKPDEP